MAPLGYEYLSISWHCLPHQLLANTGASIEPLEQLQLINCSGSNCCFWLPVKLWPGHCRLPRNQMVKVQGVCVRTGLQKDLDVH